MCSWALRAKDQEEAWNKNVMVNRVGTDNKPQCINSKNNACGLAIITFCEVISCQVITFHTVSDYGSKGPALFIQDMATMLEPKVVFPCLGNVNSVNALLANLLWNMGQSKKEQ